MKEDFKKRVYRYTIRLVKFLRALTADILTREVISQLMRSGTSIGANFFEAQSASSKKDFINFFTYALKSANESIFWFNVLLESELISKKSADECRNLLAETEELAKILASSILTMKKRL